ncbi:hypothetical protein [Carboxylicivirga taeanensis]|uniref:hypothetical protein n=1 Tax=Carboxylicivirga taeanensis TaxID=1416875 RepID=UPI003F6E1071
MKKWLSRVDTDNMLYRYLVFIIIIVFAFAYGSYKMYGNRPLFLFKNQEGKIVKVYDKKQFTRVGYAGASPSNYDAMALKLDSSKELIINTNLDYSKLFEEGMRVKVWMYRTSDEYNFVQVKCGNQVLVENNEEIGWFVFTLMIVSGIPFLFMVFIIPFVQYRNKKN